MQTKSVLFLGKKNDVYTNKALEFCKLGFSGITSCLSDWGEKLPEEAMVWEGDYIISYLSRWIVPKSVLGKAKIAAINFHPAPPGYPGIGCGNFALYGGETEYGVTCHHMEPRVDSGSIILTKHFSILATDNIETLLSRVYDYQLVLFYDIISMIFRGEELPVSDEKWEGDPLTFKKLNELRRITSNMSREEIEKRIRSTDFGPWRPIIEIQGFTFELKGRINGNKIL